MVARVVGFKQSNKANSEFSMASTIEEAERVGKKYIQNVDYSKFNIDVANEINKQLGKISGEFGSKAFSKLKAISTFPKGMSSKWSGVYDRENESIYLRNVSKKDAMHKLKTDAEKQKSIGWWASGKAVGVIDHELGHAIANSLVDGDKMAKINSLRKEYKTKILRSHGKLSSADFLSEYGFSNTNEFIAESVSEYMTEENPRELSKAVVAIMKG